MPSDKYLFVGNSIHMCMRRMENVSGSCWRYSDIL